MQKSIVFRGFSEWWKQNSKSFEEGTDFLKSPQSYLNQSGKNTVKRYDDYALTIANILAFLCLEMPMSRTSYKKRVSSQKETKQGFFSSTYTCVSADTEVSIHPQKTSVNLKPVKTLLKNFRLFPNMVAFLTVANVVQTF